MALSECWFLELSLCPDPFKHRMSFEKQPKERALGVKPFSLPGAWPALLPKLAVPFPSGRGSGTAPLGPAGGLAGDAGRGGRGVCFPGRKP